MSDTSRPVLGTRSILSLRRLPAALLAPLVVAYLLYEEPLLGLAVLPVAALAGIFAWLETRDPDCASWAAGIAPLLVDAWPTALVLAAALLVLVLAVAYRIPLLLALGALLVFVPERAGPLGAVFLGTALAAWPVASEPRGHPVWENRTTLLAGAALPVLGAVWAGVSILLVPLVALVAFGTLYLSRQPANVRLGQTVVGAGIALAAFPAMGGFVLAAIGRFPALPALPTLAASWGLVALGGLAVLVALGIDTGFRSLGHREAVWAPPLMIGVAWSLALAAQGEFRAAFPVVAIALGMVAVPVAVGARRLAVMARHHPLADVGITAVMLLVLPLRTLL